MRFWFSASSDPLVAIPRCVYRVLFVKRFVTGGAACLIKRVKASVSSRCRMKINLITEDGISNLPIPVKIPWEYYDYLSEGVSGIKDFLIVGEHMARR